MTTLQTQAHVVPGKDLNLSVHIPEGVEEGTHDIVLIIKDKTDKARVPPKFLNIEGAHRFAIPIDSEVVDPTMTFRREDIYGDDGR